MFYKDLMWVRKVIDNKDNDLQHLIALKNLTLAFELKYTDELFDSDAKFHDYWINAIDALADLKRRLTK